MNLFTAHIREESEQKAYQSVNEHSFETMKLAGKYARSTDLESLAKLSAILHDAGKLCSAFNDYINGNNNIRRGEIDHCYPGARFLNEKCKESDQKGAREVSDLIGRVIISHHGLKNWLDDNCKDYYKYRVEKSERYQEIQGNIREMVSDEMMDDLLRDAICEIQTVIKPIKKLAKNGSAERSEYQKLLNFYYGQLERLLTSCLVDADRTDTTNFINNTNIEQVSNLSSWTDYCSKVEEISNGFRNKTDHISVLRSDISDRCKNYADKEANICQLVVPTGGGKTISSLRFAANYCRIHNKERVFYIAPYMSILEQNAEVFRKILGDDAICEHHSNIITDIDGADELAEYELEIDKWQKPMIVTTMVQFLNTLFSDKMSAVRRYHQLTNSVIIIDEVQSIPVKCIDLFNGAMNFLSTVGNSSVVLCSATQPAFTSANLKMMIDQNASMTGDYRQDFAALERTKPKLVANLKTLTYEEVARICLDEINANLKVLMIVNTKGAASNLYKLLTEMCDKDTEIYHLSTSLCPARRKKIISAMKESLGNPQKKVLCVSTQLIEAGVDISFPCVIRSVSGLDSIAQAAGRCNRNGEYKDCCEVKIINLEENITYLKDIRLAANVTKVLAHINGEENLLSVERLDEYFQKYFLERKDELSYNVKDLECDTDLLTMLSTNTTRNTNPNQKLVTNCQSFKRAGELFNVIDENTTEIIVPDDDEARSLIAQLEEGIYYSDTAEILRKLQKYTVSVYSHILGKLKTQNALAYIALMHNGRASSHGVFVLDERFYDTELGILIEGKPMDLLLF